jgi:hypothetical protein
MTNRAVATVETDRLAKLIRLIFSSDNSGEIVGAVMAAKRVLASENLDAFWLADRFALGATLVAVTPDDESSERNDRSAAWYAFHRRHSLSPRERLFVENIASRSGPLSARQRQWLADIVNRLEAA